MSRLTPVSCVVATALAICMAGQAAWGHTFPPVRTVVVQVERCELAVLVGYRPGSGDETQTTLKLIASQPKSQVLAATRSVLANQAMSALVFSIDGQPLVPTSVRAKVGADPMGDRPMVVLLVTFAIPERGGSLSVRAKEPRTTRISWTDRASHRVDLAQAPSQVHWFSDVAAFLLTIAGTTGVPACATSQSSSH